MSSTALPSIALQTKDTARRRFADLKEIAPHDVPALALDHPAVIEGRTLFPSRVFAASAVPRVLISGINHRKLGDRVTKGGWRGMPIFALTLEERATCPRTCHHWLTCYGAGMQYARRIEAGPELERVLERELDELQHCYPNGFVVRLHNLGDFYSPEYVVRWARWIEQYPALHVFGYTAHRDNEIAATVRIISELCWDRFAIRFSPAEAGEQRACTLWSMPDRQPRDGVICPAQTGKTACCGTCGLCWSPTAKGKTIYFIAHGARMQGKPAGQSMSNSISIKEFFATAGSRFTKQDAAIIGPALQELAASGQATDNSIVEIAHSSNSPLHAYFEWNNEKAAHQYRLGQAREIATSIRVRLISGAELPANERVTVRITSDIAPRPAPPATRSISANDGQGESAESHASEALTELELFTLRFQRYASIWPRFNEIFSPVFAAIVAAKRRHENPTAGPPQPAPLKIGELPAAKAKSSYLLTDIVERPSSLPPALHRRARDLAETRQQPLRVIDGKFQIGDEMFTAEQIMAMRPVETSNG